MQEDPDFYYSKEYIALQERSESFQLMTGRRPRILLTNMEESSEAKAMQIFAIIYSDVGFDVDISPMCVTAQVVARMAVDNDVHVVNILASQDDRSLLSLLIGELKKQDAGEIKVILSSGHLTVNPLGKNQDFERLVGRSASKILNLIGGG